MSKSTSTTTPKKVDPKVEGWTWVIGFRKWHYFRDYRSLCGKVMLLVHPSMGYDTDGSESEDNCMACRNKLTSSMR